MRRLPNKMSSDVRYALNAVCPYFTMFPLEYPMRVLDPRILRTYRKVIVCDPYCGRGTAIFAARMRCVAAYGIDIAPVAVAIARAKLANTTTGQAMELFDELLVSTGDVEVPSGAFWNAAYHPKTLSIVCRLRLALLGLRGDAAAMLRAVLLGALHGPLAKSKEGASYLSNQMPRTFAAKPDYAVKFWRRKRFKAPAVDVRTIVRKRLDRAFQELIPLPQTGVADVQCADSRLTSAFARLDRKITHVITSPPYYGLRTYAQDQWLREWFLGGSEEVDYRREPGLDHSSPKAFSNAMARVWDNVGDHASERIRLYIRFGGIRSRSSPADEILRASLKQSGHPWRIVTRHRANTASMGRRQAVQMSKVNDPVEEHDYVVCLS